MSSIGREFDRRSSSIYPLLERTGGIRPIARTPSRLALPLGEREAIPRGLVAKQSLRSIARNLHRAPSTISREVRRNGGAEHYRAARSDARAWDRAVPGHWEGDLIAGSSNSFIAKLVERHTRFVLLAKVKNKDSYNVIQALIKQSRQLPKELHRSLTWDRGSEMAGYKTITLTTDIDVFLCEPHSPWQRGTNVSTNRLLRQYFSKGTDL